MKPWKKTGATIGGGQSSRATISTHSWILTSYDLYHSATPPCLEHAPCFVAALVYVPSLHLPDASAGFAAVFDAALDFLVDFDAPDFFAASADGVADFEASAVLPAGATDDDLVAAFFVVSDAAAAVAAFLPACAPAECTPRPVTITNANAVRNLQIRMVPPGG